MGTGVGVAAAGDVCHLRHRLAVAVHRRHPDPGCRPSRRALPPDELGSGLSERSRSRSAPRPGRAGPARGRANELTPSTGCAATRGRCRPGRGAASRGAGRRPSSTPRRGGSSGHCSEPEPLRLDRLPDVDERVTDDPHVRADGPAHDRVGDAGLLGARAPGGRRGRRPGAAGPGSKSSRWSARSSTPPRYSTTTPSIRRSSPQTFSTSSASWRPSTKIRLARATRALAPWTATEPRRRPGRLGRRAVRAGGAARITGLPSSRKPGPEREGTALAAPVLQRERVQVAVDGDDLAAPVGGDLLDDRADLGAAPRRRGRSWAASSRRRARRCRSDRSRPITLGAGRVRQPGGTPPRVHGSPLVESRTRPARLRRSSVDLVVSSGSASGLSSPGEVLGAVVRPVGLAWSLGRRTGRYPQISGSRFWDRGSCS